MFQEVSDHGGVSIGTNSIHIVHMEGRNLKMLIVKGMVTVQRDGWTLKSNVMGQYDENEDINFKDLKERNRDYLDDVPNNLGIY